MTSIFAWLRPWLCGGKKAERPVPTLPPVRNLPADPSRLRAIFYVSAHAVVDGTSRAELTDAWDKWLAGERPMYLTGIDRVELYAVEGDTDPGPAAPSVCVPERDTEWVADV